MTTKLLSIIAIMLTLPLCGAQRLQRIMGHIKPSMPAAATAATAKVSNSEEVVISPEVKALVDSLMPLFLRLYTNDDFEGLKKAIAESTDINKDVEAARDSEGNTIVDWAFDDEQWDVLKFLMIKGVSLDSTRMLGNAIRDGKSITSIKKLVEEFKADINAKNKHAFNQTAIMIASSHGRVEVIKYLVNECRVDVNRDSKSGRWALLVAMQNNRMEAVKCLVEECGADVTLKFDSYVPPLYKFADKNNVEMVKYLEQAAAYQNDQKAKHANKVMKHYAFFLHSAL